MIENLADKMDRLTHLAKVAGAHVCIDLDMWVRPERKITVDVEWSVWDGRTHFKGATPEEALHAAEVAHDIVRAEVPDAVVMP